MDASTQPAPAATRLRWHERAGYGLGDAGGNVITCLIMSFLNFYYTDVAGLAPAMVGAMFLAVRLVDALADPLMGMLADRTDSRWGRYRPWQLWMALPLAVAAVMAFSVPAWSPQAKLAWACVSYFALSLGYTAANVPYCAMINAITDVRREILACQSWRFALCGVATLLVSVGLPWLVQWLGQGDAARGYQLGVAAMCVLAAAMLLGCFASVRERIRPARLHLGMRASLAVVWGNDQLRITMAMSFLLINVMNLRGGGYLYFVTYVLGGDAAYASAFLGAVALAAIAGAGLAAPLARRGDTLKVYVRVNLLLAALSLALWFVPCGAQWRGPWLVLAFVNGTVLGLTLPLHFALIAFADDYGAWKSGQRVSGLNFAFNLLAIKLSWAASAGVIALVLSWVAYRAGHPQTLLAQRGITALETLIPAALHLALALLARHCRLDEPRMRVIAAELRQRGVA